MAFLQVLRPLFRILVFVLFCAGPICALANTGPTLEISGEVSIGGSGNDTSGKDNWDKAAIVSQFIASVVIVLVGLVITAGIQRTQISTNRHTAKAQLEASRETAKAQIKASDIRAQADRKLQEGDLIRQFLGHLKSTSVLERQLAIIALFEAIPEEKYFEIITAVALEDKTPPVRNTAIEKMKTSSDPKVRRALAIILNDMNRPDEERALARESAFESSLLTGGTPTTVVLAASSASEHAFESVQLGGGLFTRSLIDVLQELHESRKGEAPIFVRDLMNETRSRMLQYQSEMSISHPVSPHFSEENVSEPIPLVGPNLPYSEVSAVVVGSNGPPGSDRLSCLQFAESSATEFEEKFNDLLGGKIKSNVLVGDAARATNVLSAISRAAQESLEGSLLILYFGGHSHIDNNGELNLILHDSNIEHYSDMIAMSQVKRALAKSKASITVIVLDTSFSGAASSALR